MGAGEKLEAVEMKNQLCPNKRKNFWKMIPESLKLEKKANPSPGPVFYLQAFEGQRAKAQQKSMKTSFRSGH